MAGRSGGRARRWCSEAAQHLSARLRLSNLRGPKEAMAKAPCFERLWRLLSAPEPGLWRQYRAAVEGPERQREALELLASVVWHLELATSLAPWPTQKMEQFYSQLLSAQTDALTPWKIWVDG